MQNFLTVNEAVNILKTTLKYIYKLAFLRKIPFYKPNNGRLLFDEAELEEWVRKGRVTTRDELNERAVSMLNSRGKA